MGQEKMFNFVKNISDSITSVSGRDQAILQSLELASDFRRGFYQQSMDFEARGQILVKIIKGCCDAALMDECDNELIMMSKFNECVRKFKAQTHNMLDCMIENAEVLNSLCMSEALQTTSIVAAFSEINADCHVEKEITQRVGFLKIAIACELAKLTSSPFYRDNWDDCSQQSNVSVTADSKKKNEDPGKKDFRTTVIATAADSKSIATDSKKTQKKTGTVKK